MWVGTGSVWGPKLGFLPKTHPEQHKEHGLGHGPEDGGKEDPLQPKVKEWWILRKALERHQIPPGWLQRAQWGQQAPEAINPVLRGHELLEQGAECLWIPLAPLESEDPGSHWIKPFGSNRFDFSFFIFFSLSRAAMTCHVKAFY